MIFSEVTIKFLFDFNEGTSLTLTTRQSSVNTDNIWSWVVLRTSGFEVTTGSPTGNVGETAAINFKAAFDLDFPTGYVTSIQNINEVVIQSETSGEDFIAVEIVDGLVIPGDSGLYEVTFNNITAPVDITNIEFVLSRSPHYVNTPFDFETTTSASIDIFIWNGDLASVPSEPTQQLTKIRPAVNYTEFNTNISNILKEKLDGKPIITLSSTTQIYNSADNEVKWLKWVVSYNDTTNTIADIENTLIGTEGYGYYSEGVNPTRPVGRVLTSSDLRKVDRTGFIIIPFFNDGTITSIDIDSDGGEINETETPVATDNSNAAVQYLTIDVSATTNDQYIDVVFNGPDVTYTYDIMDECRYEPKQFVFKNKWGLYDSVTMFKKSSTNLATTNDDFTNAYISNGSYSVTNHQKQKINIQGKESLSCNTGYINEKENELYKEMMLSDKVFLYEFGTLNPVNVKSPNLDFKTRVNDNLINYTIEFEFAYNKIQNV